MALHPYRGGKHGADQLRRVLPSADYKAKCDLDALSAGCLHLATWSQAHRQTTSSEAQGWLVRGCYLVSCLRVQAATGLRTLVQRSAFKTRQDD